MRATQTAAVIYTTNVPRLVRFYERVAHIDVVRTEDDYCTMRVGTFELTIHAIPERYAKNSVIDSPPAVREENAIKLSFLVESLARARQAASELGGTIYGVEREWNFEGKTLCDGFDPDGNVIQLFETLER